jgi:hypothetical protein
MKKIVISCFLLFFAVKSLNAQDVFLKSGRNFTNYDYKNNDGQKEVDFVSRGGRSFELGYGFPITFSSKKAAREERSSSGLNAFKNEISFAVNSFDAYGGDINNNYSYETTYGGLKNKFSFVAKAKKFDVGLKAILGINTLIAGTQLINNSRFDLRDSDEFTGVFLETGLGVSTSYYFLDHSYFSFAYEYTRNTRPGKIDVEHINFISRTFSFGIHFKLN